MKKVFIAILGSSTLIACGGIKDKKDDAPAQWEIEGKKFEEVYRVWDSSKYKDYSYSWVDKLDDNKVQIVQVDVTDGRPSCRRLIENDQVIWTESTNDLNTHNGLPAVTLDDIYQRCWNLYQEDRQNIAFFYKQDLLVGCNRNCSLSETCEEADIPFYQLDIGGKGICSI